MQDLSELSNKPSPKFSISIVSHGQGDLVSALAEDLVRVAPASVEVLLTINIPEDEEYLSRFDGLPLKVLRNVSRMGFGANHNAAFRASSGEYFVVANPDVRLPEGAVFGGLARHLQNASIGACAPLVTNSAGRIEDSARKNPTFARVFRRRALWWLGNAPDYVGSDGLPISVDWVAGMFVAFRRDAFTCCEGFDERYFMYLEDADICRRLRAGGFHVVWDPSERVVHDARRASRSSPIHLLWHAKSMARYLGSNLPFMNRRRMSWKA